MQKEIETMVDVAIRTLIRIKNFEAAKSMPILNTCIKMQHFHMMAEAFKEHDELSYIGESIDKLHQYIEKPYVLEIQIGCIITNLLAIKNKETILIKFSKN